MRKLRKNMLIESKVVLWCLQYEQCSGSQKVPKLKFVKMLDEIYGSKTKIIWAQCRFWKFEFFILGLSRSNSVEKRCDFFLHFFYFVSENSLGFLSLGNTPHFDLLLKDVSTISIYSSLLLKPCNIVCIANITKPLWILYQNSKLLLNFG